ncbi:hypothetical protein [Ohtaekwangia koreensis]|uniref:Uncharacterized protein n=1 Tax=Ohtaekwangia koreensis TaxID=688867 RepID=A0A1T5MNW1_9BACT|nr:hypothetical protein [Ohtaekwangia koreensis]SKC89713.1 hypothetical protein SAMN05660236_5919 [Ohtaekwangia koreensis]
MNWTTLYITGKSDFRNEVMKKLEHSRLNFMPGYTGGTSDKDVHDMYWVDDEIDVREFKEAIGSKLIWKYRLRFYVCLEDFIESKNMKDQDKFTPDEIDLINYMQEHEV